jgi:hypothetical protein
MLYAKPRESLLRAMGGAARWAREQYAEDTVRRAQCMLAEIILRSS